MDTVNVLRDYGYWIVFAALALESTLVAGLIVPGIGVLVMAGFLAGLGELNIIPVLVAGYLGTMTGDNIGYLLARLAGPRIRLIQTVVARFEQTRNTLESGYPRRYLLFQFPMPLRVAFPLLVGAMRRPFGSWLMFDALASLLFVGSIGCAGYGIGLLAMALTLGRWG